MKNKFWNFKAKDKDNGELMLYGDISSSTWYGDEVTPKAFKDDLDAMGDIKNLNIYINSGGGDVFAGQAIYSMLKRHNANKTVYIDGLAASIASVIAMAGDKIIMPKNAMLMIHNSWTIAAGNKADLRKIADEMDKIDESIAGTYETKSGIEKEKIANYMDSETWFTAEEAVEQGFADEIEKEKLVAASIKGGFLMLNNQKFDLERFKNMPQIEETAEKETLIEVEEEKLNENRDESQPVSDKLADQKDQFYKLRKKINTI